MAIIVEGLLTAKIPPAAGAVKETPRPANCEATKRKNAPSQINPGSERGKIRRKTGYWQLIPVSNEKCRRNGHFLSARPTIWPSRVVQEGPPARPSPSVAGRHRAEKNRPRGLDRQSLAPPEGAPRSSPENANRLVTARRGCKVVDSPADPRRSHGTVRRTECIRRERFPRPGLRRTSRRPADGGSRPTAGRNSARAGCRPAGSAGG